MTNFVAAGFIDTSMMTATLLTKHKAKFDDDPRRQDAPNSPHHDTQTIMLRGPEDKSLEAWFRDEEITDYPAIHDWKTAKGVLSRFRHLVSPFTENRPATLGKAMIVSLKAGGVVDWHIDEGEYADAHLRFHVCMLPSPGAMMFAGVEAVNPPVGQIVLINNRILHSAINFGPTARVHLIVDVRKP